MYVLTNSNMKSTLTQLMGSNPSIAPMVINVVNMTKPMLAAPCIFTPDGSQICGKLKRWFLGLKEPFAIFEERMKGMQNCGIAAELGFSELEEGSIEILLTSFSLSPPS
ncbi:hypothetical protein SUGI_0776360 [Cryptomeria japonica]|nr:hypothetical protein SUGI_0776360 [Cryptomeria japonica]